MDWLLHPSPVPRPTPKRHGNYGGINNKTRAKIAEARDGTAQQQDSRFLTGDAWAPLPGSAPVDLLHRSPDGCCWPVGGSPQMFCNEPVKVGRYPYCPDHLKRYLSPPKDHK